MKITSSAFVEGENIPTKYTCEGEGISPPIVWGDAPINTKSFVLICDDPDAPYGTWTHWVLYNIPLNINSLEENVVVLPPGTLVGKNTAEQLGYASPCPPHGEHRYIFHLYALDCVLDIPDGATSKVIMQRIQGHVLEIATLMGKYKKKR